MLSGKVWPAHPKPLPDELLSSWIVRVGEANAIKLQTLSWMLFGNGLSPWNRDIDRNAPQWLIDALCEHTGSSYWEVFRMTLVTYGGRLYPHRQAVGQLRWILPIRSYGMRHRAFGQQFCPECLASDAIPYFRKQWRVACFTYCPEHHVDLWDACPGCGLPIVGFRGDFGRELKNARPMHVCYSCGYDFREAPRKSVSFPNEELHQLFDGMLLSLNASDSQAGQFDLGYYAVMHQFCRVMGMRQNQGRLQRFIEEQLDLPHLSLQQGLISVEQRSHGERHRLMLCALWLMADVRRRLESAWLSKALRYNLMLRDFDDAPEWYLLLAERFSDWRKGVLHSRLTHEL
ncbi:MAG: TniQ family protein [Dechloromonas sp.]|jgi:hypothetical protein|nr:TniQ family protein [Dechloromonas sp.]